MKQLVFLTVVLIPFLSACVTLSEKASKVQFHSQMSNAIIGCKRLGPVSVNLPSAGAFAHAVSAALRERAAELGADTVVVLNLDKTLARSTYQGMAMKCYD
jgi:hypothetical protein